MKRISMLIGAIALFAVAAYFLFGPNATENTMVPEAQAAQTQAGFTVNTIDGGTFSLDANKGKVVLVNFWATWCPPCRLEIPHFVEMYDEHKDAGFRIVGISLDRKGVGVVNDWLAQNPVNYPIAMGEDGALFNEYQQLIDASERGGIPYSVIIDANGNVAHTIVGYRDKAQWMEMIGPLLKDVKM